MENILNTPAPLLQPVIVESHDPNGDPQIFITYSGAPVPLQFITQKTRHKRDLNEYTTILNMGSSSGMSADEAILVSKMLAEGSELSKKSAEYLNVNGEKNEGREDYWAQVRDSFDASRVV